MLMAVIRPLRAQEKHLVAGGAMFVAGGMIQRVVLLGFIRFREEPGRQRAFGVDGRLADGG
jgi:hypothetical protein